LRRSEHVHDFRREVSEFFRETILKCVSVAPEGEVPILFSDDEHSMVERGSEALDCVACGTSESVGQLAAKLNLMDVLSRIRIDLDSKTVWLTLDETLQIAVEVFDVFLCPFKT
jgi:hypothetical protein